MPELPEVETVRRGLEPVMESMTVLSLETRRANLRFPFPDNFAERVSGRRIIGLGRRAKYLLIDLDDGMTIIAHLGMSGSFRIEQGGIADLPGEFHNPRSKDGKHDHVVFHLENGEAACRVIYNDPRRFGFMHLWPRAELDLYPAFAVLGPEPTGNMLAPADLAMRLRNRAQPLKGMLLDQSVIAGLGNIYVCEALWRSGLSPLRKAATLVNEDGSPRAELVELTQAIREVIADAIAAGGSSLRDHIQTDGSLGYFQHSFAVYDQEGEPCRREGCAGTVSRIVQSGRSTFFCATCQK